MHAQKGAAEEGTYRFVLTRFDWSPTVEYVERNYGEVRRTRCVPWPTGLALPKRRPDMDRWRPKGPDENPPGGEDVCMVFCNDPHFRTRLMKTGWMDITVSWFEHHRDIPAVIPGVPAGLRVAVAPAAGVVHPSARESGATA